VLGSEVLPENRDSLPLPHPRSRLPALGLAGSSGNPRQRVSRVWPRVTKEPGDSDLMNQRGVPRSGPKEGADIMPTRRTLHERLFRPALRDSSRHEPLSPGSFVTRGHMLLPAARCSPWFVFFPLSFSSFWSLWSLTPFPGSCGREEEWRSRETTPLFRPQGCCTSSV
jgi:hypothetical protein